MKMFFEGTSFAIPVRLSNGTNPNEGTVEIFYQNRQEITD